MKTLEKNLTHSGYDLTQIHREGFFAIYKKKKKDHESFSFEVIKIKSHNGYTIGGNYCPPSEMYPSNEQWGALGYSCATKQEAYAVFDKMKSQNEESEQLAVIGEKRGRGRPKGVKNKHRGK